MMHTVIRTAGKLSRTIWLPMLIGLGAYVVLVGEPLMLLLIGLFGAIGLGLRWIEKTPDEEMGRQ